MFITLTPESPWRSGWRRWNRSVGNRGGIYKTCQSLFEHSVV